MERTVILMIFLYYIGGSATQKYVFISTAMNWTDAQTYCRQHYADLAYVDNEIDQEMIQRTADEHSFEYAFIGLTRDADNVSSWRWSIGSEVTYTNWINLRENHRTKGAMAYLGRWNHFHESNSLPFFCINLPIVEEKKTWEEALEHCRGTNTNLASIRSHSDLLAVQRMMWKASVSRLWIGLRFLGDGWLWVAGDPLEFQAWSKPADPDRQCHLLNRCAAVSSVGLWETQDCQERLFFICDMTIVM